ncbi:MAG: phosphoribosylaminoimidazolesuccinocarboxamide synthase [Bacteroidales bacterium]|nr:phosphoribosylaminoimidazolesuccinocarboxamide synthase [Bacteroidales bacterium]
MEKRDKMLEGHTKAVYATDRPDRIVLHFKDMATAYHGIKRARIAGKGILANRISALLFQTLQAQGVSSHFIEILNDREQLCQKLWMIPLRLVVRNVAAGSIVRRLGQSEGTVFREPVIELSYKNEALDHPLINRHHAVAMGIADRAELDIMCDVAYRVNDVLDGLFRACGIRLVDFKLEFGRTAAGEIVVADEISPDTCRLWDLESGRRLDRDRFRRDMGDIIAAYQEVYDRLCNHAKND